MLHVIQYSLGSIFKIFVFFFLAITVYSFFGNHLFGRINKGAIMDEQLNYKNFFSGILTLFKVSTKNNWRLILTDSQRLNPYCGGDERQCGQNWWVTHGFYFSFLIICHYVLLNILIFALVDQFEST